MSRKKARRRKKAARRALSAALALVLAAGLGLSLRQWGFGLTRVAGTSMSDTLRDGDVALVTRFDYLGGRTPDFGDVVACRFPGRTDTYLKRVAGLPGETVTIAGGTLYRDGARVSEPYVSSFPEDYAVALGEGEYLLLGDNRADSYDSRMPDMGPVGAEAFLGRARLILWPLSRFGIIK